jgi:hypothetical protein
MNEPLSLITLLARSENLNAAWQEALSAVALGEDESLSSLREHLTIDACELTLQHGQAFRQLIGEGLEASAMALLRVLHEALLRATWLLYAAAEAEIARLGAPHLPATLKQANSLPLANVLLAEVEASDAPDQLKRGLREFRDVSWAGMNSYAHAGLLALGRVSMGHPEAHLIQAVQVSNAHCYAANMLAATVLHPEGAPGDISVIALSYPGCMLAVERR